MSYRPSRLSAAAAALVFAGCFAARKPISLEFAAIEGLPSEPPIDAAGVQVIADDADLPDGITPSREGTRLRDLVAFDKDTPTARDPHRLLGAVKAVEGSPDGRAALIAAARAEAGRHGGNAIYLLERERHDVVTALVLHVSHAPRDKVFPTASTLLSTPPPPADGYAPSGDPIPIDLASPAPLQIAAERGECLAIHLALEPDARLTPNLAKPSATRRDPTGVEFVGMSRTSMRFSQRDYVFVLGCAFMAGEQRIEFGHKLGRGSARAQIRRKRLEERDVAKLEREQAAGLAKAKKDDEANARKQCRACYPLLSVCSTAEHPSSCKDYMHCLSRTNTRLEDCATAP